MNTNDTYGWMQTFTGKKLFPLNPKPEDIDIRDIAHALSLVGRYGGHAPTFYSVGAHSLLTSHLCKSHPLEALLHDAAEAYIGDMVRPLKKFVPQFLLAEQIMEEVIFAKFGLPQHLPPEVKAADNLALMIERRELGIVPIESWGPELEALKLPPQSFDTSFYFNISPASVEHLFVRRYECLSLGLRK